MATIEAASKKLRGSAFLEFAEKNHDGFGSNPISKVVTMLQSLTEEIDEDIKAEQDLFDKYECWYKTVMGAKKASNAEAVETISALTSYIDDIDSGRIEFSSEGADATKDVAELKTELEKSKSLREKEEEDFEAAKDEMETTIGALERALEELEKGTEGSFLSSSADVQKLVSLGQAVLSDADVRALQNSLQPDHNMKYKKASGKIQELIADMLQTFKDNLDDAKEKEKESKKQYKTLSSAKKDQLKQAQNALEALGGETASREEAKEEAKKEIEDLEEQIKKDKGFMDTVTDAYEGKLEAWKERKKLMTGEIYSISEAMGILTSDDARDSMSTAFDKDKVFSFAQLSARKVDRHLGRIVASTLRKHAKGRNARLLRLAARVEREDGDGDEGSEGFDKVLKILNNVKKDMTKESKEDKEKKDECDTKLTEKTSEAQSSANFIDEKSRMINRTKFEITELYEKVNKTVEEVEELEWELNDLTNERADTNEAYEKEKAGLISAIDFIKQAKKALTKFYKKNNFNLLQTEAQSGETKSTRVEKRQPDLVVEAGKAPPPPPATVTKEYKGRGGNKGIQGLMQDIADDVQHDLDELEKNEEDSAKNFADTEAETNDAIGSKMDFKQDLEDQIAGKLDDVSTANKAKMGEQDTLDAVVQGLKAIEPSCNYVFTTLKTRIKNRKIEAEGINSAIKALGGDESAVEFKEANK